MAHCKYCPYCDPDSEEYKRLEPEMQAVLTVVESYVFGDGCPDVDFDLCGGDCYGMLPEAEYDDMDFEWREHS